MGIIVSTYSRISALRSEIEQNNGKRGNAARRSELKELEVKTVAWDARRAQIQANIRGRIQRPRSEQQIADTRAQITQYAAATIRRGEYGEILVASKNRYGSAKNEGRTFIPTRLLTHPDLHVVAAFQAAWALVDRAGEDLIPQPGSEFDKKGRGWAINHDLYGYVPGLALVQVRRWESSGKYSSVTKRYFVTDGSSAVEIANGKKSLIKRAATADAAPDSPLRMIKSILPPAWQEMIPGNAPQLVAPASARTTMTTYKIVQRSGDRLLSLYDDSTQYHLGKLMTNRLGKRAGEYTEYRGQIHDGGFYSHPSVQRCLELQREDRLAPNCQSQTTTFVLLECTIGGRIARFDNGKLASTYLTPVKILAEYLFSEMPDLKI